MVEVTSMVSMEGGRDRFGICPAAPTADARDVVRWPHGRFFFQG